MYLMKCQHSYEDRAIQCLLLSTALVLPALAVHADAPIITGQPVSEVLGLGQSAGLSVTASGAAPLAYQWFKDGVVLVGQTNSTLAFASFQFTNSGCYSAVITNATGLAISLPASLSLSNAPLRAWGYNAYGQLGNGTTNNAGLPSLVMNGAVVAAAGGFHSLSVAPDGTLWTMGENNFGQLGDGTTNNAALPTAVASNVVAVAAGTAHSLYVTTDGTLRAMGYNGYGQLGNGTTNSSGLPIVVASNVVAVAAGGFHSLFLTADGTLWGMGLNGFGQLGHGRGVAYLPVAVASNVVAAVAGSLHSLFVSVDGTLWATGWNNYGQLGNGTTITPTAPVPVASPVVAMAAGYAHSLFAKADGTLWAMGQNSYGQLGDSSIATRASPVLVATNVVAVAAGYSHSMFTKGDATLWAMGYNNYGQLGNGTMVTQTNMPILVNGGGLVASSLAKGPLAYHASAIASALPVLSPLSNQVLYAGQPLWFTASVSAGDGPFSYQWLFNSAIITGATNAAYALANVAMSNAGNFAVTVTGLLGRTATAAANVTVMNLPVQPASAMVSLGQPASLTAAYGGAGPFGYQWLKDGVILTGQTGSTLSIASFQFTDSGSYCVVATNLTETVISAPAILCVSNAPLRGWGYNFYGALGLGTTGGVSNRPARIASNVVASAGGAGHSLYVTADGALWSMGYNAYGQIGDGTTSNASLPLAVASNVVGVAAGLYHSLFIRADGTLWATGANGYGQLGNGTTNNATTAVPVAIGVVAVAAGKYHSLYLTANGTLWGMGQNSSGQLGNGTSVSTNRPIVVASNVLSMAAGGTHSLYVTANGALWAVGGNSYGQLGGTPPISPYRAFVVASNVVTAAAGDAHSLYVTASHTLWGMGLDSYGQLGNGSTTGGVRPVVVVSDDVMAVSAGLSHSLFVALDGTLWAMGDNTRGELGGDTTPLTYSVTPRLVNGGGMAAASLARGCECDHPLVIAAAAPAVNPLAPQIVYASQPLSFTASLSDGDGPFTYQWLFNGTNLTGAINAVYPIASAAFSDAGNYSVMVTGLYGSATSGLAALTVLPIASDPTKLIPSVNGSTLTVSWPADHLGWILQAQTNGLNAGVSANWFDVPGTGSGNAAVITIDCGNPAVFYRLRHP